MTRDQLLHQIRRAIRYPRELWRHRRFLFVFDVGPIAHNWRAAWIRTDPEEFERRMSAAFEPMTDEEADLFLCGTGHCPHDPCPHV